jgi:hypothetical protein
MFSEECADENISLVSQEVEGGQINFQSEEFLNFYCFSVLE